jgi:hypothetical protein
MGAALLTGAITRATTAPTLAVWAKDDPVALAAPTRATMNIPASVSVNEYRDEVADSIATQPLGAFADAFATFFEHRNHW